MLAAAPSTRPISSTYFSSPPHFTGLVYHGRCHGRLKADTPSGYPPRRFSRATGVDCRHLRRRRRDHSRAAAAAYVADITVRRSQTAPATCRAATRRNRGRRQEFAVTANFTREHDSIQRPALGSISQMLPTTIAEQICIATPAAANSIYHPNLLLRSIHRRRRRRSGGGGGGGLLFCCVLRGMGGGRAQVFNFLSCARYFVVLRALWLVSQGMAETS